MEIKYLKLIKTIADEGNISNSADRLFLTQSALSHQLREIEERMGFKVFIRSRNNWKLTAEGKELYSLSEKVLNEIEQGMKKIQDIQDGCKGTIRISTECYSFYQGLPEFAQKMALLYPELDIQLNVEGTKHPFSQILSDQLDMILTTEKPDHDALEALPLFADEMLAIVHEENPLSLKEHLSPKDFADQHLIIHSYPLETVSVYQHFLKVNRVEPFRITAIPMTEIALEMVSANMGIMCMPKWALRSFKLSESLKFVRLAVQGFKRNHYLVYRQSDKSKVYVRDFIDNLEESFLRHG